MDPHCSQTPLRQPTPRLHRWQMTLHRLQTHLREMQMHLHRVPTPLRRPPMALHVVQATLRRVQIRLHGAQPRQPACDAPSLIGPSAHCAPNWQFPSDYGV
jgi:hypothetical protein